MEAGLLQPPDLWHVDGAPAGRELLFSAETHQTSNLREVTKPSGAPRSHLPA